VTGHHASSATNCPRQGIMRPAGVFSAPAFSAPEGDPNIRRGRAVLQPVYRSRIAAEMFASLPAPARRLQIADGRCAVLDDVRVGHDHIRR
jgi:hypothetical protein